MSSSKITNYFITFLPQLWCGKLWVVNHHLHAEPLFFFTNHTLPLATRRCENFFGSRLFRSKLDEFGMSNAMWLLSWQVFINSYRVSHINCCEFFCVYTFSFGIFGNCHKLEFVYEKVFRTRINPRYQHQNM